MFWSKVKYKQILLTLFATTQKSEKLQGCEIGPSMTG